MGEGQVVEASEGKAEGPVPLEGMGMRHYGGGKAGKVKFFQRQQREK